MGFRFNEKRRAVQTFARPAELCSLLSVDRMTNLETEELALQSTESAIPLEFPSQIHPVVSCLKVKLQTLGSKCNFPISFTVYELHRRLSFVLQKGFQTWHWSREKQSLFDFVSGLTSGTLFVHHSRSVLADFLSALDSTH